MQHTAYNKIGDIQSAFVRIHRIRAKRSMNARYCAIQFTHKTANTVQNVLVAFFVIIRSILIFFVGHILHHSKSIRNKERSVVWQKNVRFIRLIAARL